MGGGGGGGGQRGRGGPRGGCQAGSGRGRPAQVPAEVLAQGGVLPRGYRRGGRGGGRHLQAGFLGSHGRGQGVQEGVHASCDAGRRRHVGQARPDQVHSPQGPGHVSSGQPVEQSAALRRPLPLEGGRPGRTELEAGGRWMSPAASTLPPPYLITLIDYYYILTRRRGQ